MYLDWAILHYSFRRQKMIDKIKENWEKILLILKEEHEVSDVSYRTWLQPLTPYSFKGNTVTIIVPEQTFLAYVKKKYGLLLKVTISEFLDQDCDVDFKVKDQIEEEKQAQAPSLIQKPKIYLRYLRCRFQQQLSSCSSPCSCGISRRDLQSPFYLRRRWSWKNPSDARNCSFYFKKQPKRQDPLCQL